MAEIANENPDKHKLKYGTRKCVEEINGILQDNPFWVELKVIAGLK